MYRRVPKSTISMEYYRLQKNIFDKHKIKRLILLKYSNYVTKTVTSLLQLHKAEKVFSFMKNAKNTEPYENIQTKMLP